MPYRTGPADPVATNWTIMFVDTVDSTEAKVKYADELYAISRRLLDLFEIVRDETSMITRRRDCIPAASIRFNGDGAMVLFDGTVIGAQTAIKAAQMIHRKVEAENLAYSHPKFQMHIRIGIASGECIAIPMGERQEPIGRPADLAARLCAEADPDGIMIDENTKNLAGLEEERDCIYVTRRLALKGIGDSPDGHHRFYAVTPGHLFRPIQSQLFENGLLKLYIDRPALALEMSPEKILEYAAPESDLLISGRTLAAWTRGSNLESLRKAIMEKALHVRMVLLRPDVAPYLPEEEMPAHYSDLQVARLSFQQLSEEVEQANKGSLEVRETETVIFDGTTSFTAMLAGKASNRLLVLQDINASSFDGKACLLLACACAAGVNGQDCIAEGLKRRTERIFNRATRLTVDAVGAAR